ncbi:hypothetical protein EDD21DRAFT_64356 [Dissophora ornata]|nr:hypothetical protein EDD21DRAFT_64356 [Dissophora ornata]
MSRAVQASGIGSICVPYTSRWFLKLLLLIASQHGCLELCSLQAVSDVWCRTACLSLLSLISLLSLGGCCKGCWKPCCSVCCICVCSAEISPTV